MVVLAMGVPLSAKQSLKKPNIVFFFIDDMGYRDLGCYGADVVETPNIDALAEEGTRFTRAYVPAAVCAPSRAAVLSGQHNLKLGLWRASHDIAPDTMTLPKVLSSSGYQTWHLGKWHMGEKSAGNAPVDLGFDIGIAGGPY